MLANSQNLSLFYCFLYFLLMHIGVWLSTNLQFILKNQKSFVIAIVLAIPISIASYFAAKHGYVAFSSSVWAIRFFGFAVSYFVFPLLTWTILGESMFTVKTMICVFLAFLIVLVQIYL